MGNLMENVKKAQMMVQQETARVQQELQECVCNIALLLWKSMVFAHGVATTNVAQDGV